MESRRRLLRPALALQPVVLIACGDVQDVEERANSRGDPELVDCLVGIRCAAAVGCSLIRCPFVLGVFAFGIWALVCWRGKVDSEEGAVESSETTDVER